MKRFLASTNSGLISTSDVFFSLAALEIALIVLVMFFFLTFLRFLVASSSFYCSDLGASRSLFSVLDLYCSCFLLFGLGVRSSYFSWVLTYLTALFASFLAKILTLLDLLETLERALSFLLVMLLLLVLSA